MSKNRELFAALHDVDVLSNQDADLRNKALDGLLQADPSDVDAFRSALVKHKAFWEGFAGGIMQTPQPVPADAVVPMVPAPDFFTTDDFLDPATQPSFQQIHQLAAEQRVQLGLKQASNQEPELSDEINALLPAGIADVKKNEVMKAFEAYVAGMSQDDLLKQKQVLEGANSIAAQLEPHATALHNAGVDDTWVKGVLGARYLQVYLPTTTLVSALNAADLVSLKTTLKNTLGQHSYIDNAVTADNIDLIRKSMLHGFINHLNSTKTAQLDKSTNIIKFQRALESVGVTQVAWIKIADMNDLKQWVRSHAFKYRLPLVSRLGLGAHPKLVEAFDLLSPTKQRSFLPVKPEEELLKRSKLRHLLNAQADNVVEYYLGADVDAAVISSIVAENERLSGIMAIHNAVLAQVLANFKPAITLGEMQIKRINAAFLTDDVPPIARDFSQIAAYQALIAVIKAECPKVVDADFDKEFAVSADADSVQQKMLVQQQHNQHLFTALHARDCSTNKELLHVFLKWFKQQEVSPAVIAGLQSNLESSHTRVDFIKKYKSDAALSARLTNELSEALFAKIKATELKKQLVADPDVAAGLLKLQITELTSSYELLDERVQQLDFIKDIQAIHLFNPAFQIKASKESKEMHKHYQHLLDESLLVIDKLRRDEAALQSYLDSLPVVEPLKDSAAILALKTNLLSKVEAVKKLLEAYMAVSKSLKDPILKELDAVAAKGRNYLYYADGIRCYKREGTQEEDYFQTPLKDDKTGAMVPGGRILNHLLGVDALSAEQVRVYEVLHQDAEKKGVFTQKGSHIDVESIAKKGGAPNIVPGKFVIEEFPHAKQGGGPTEGLEQAQVNFAMTMAMQMLAEMDGAPTQDQPIRLMGDKKIELEYLWTALLYLGKHNPKMKFGMDALVVYSNKFDPKTQQGTFFGLSKTSIYETIFKKYPAVVDPHIEKFKDFTEEKVAKKDHVDKKLQAIPELKKELQSFKDKAQKIQDTDGPTPVSAA
ncbi:MAG: hypothetical protein ACHP65_07160 [Legionellales bacterium]